MPDVYTYDELPKQLRVQIIHIIRDSFGDSRLDWVKQLYNDAHEILCREYGEFRLGGEYENDEQCLFNFFLNTKDTEKALDVVELCFRFIDYVMRKDASRSKIRPDAAIDELNARFQEHGIGYAFESRDIIRIDSKLIHAEVVKPALQLLKGTAYRGANQEFLSAHEHYRHGKYKECLNDCLKSFESVLKAICAKRKWQHDPDKDAAKRLLDICFDKGLIPQFLQSEFSGLRTTLEAGIPTTRNRQSGHGQGTTPKDVPQYFASYILHLTATSILFLAEAESA
jgi:hypothetical protein